MNNLETARPLVSVVIPTKDRPELLREALASVDALRGPDFDLEIIVSDNGSSTDMEPIARAVGGRLVHATVRGPAATRNAGLAAANGDFVAFLDDDDLWTTEHLRPHLKFLAEHPDFGAVMGQIVVTSPQAEPLFDPAPESLPADGWVFGKFLVGWPQIGAFLIRTEVARSLGGFDEALMAGEDWDFHLRLAKSWKIGLVKVPSLLFRKRDSTASEDEVNRFRSRVTDKIFLKHALHAGRQRPSWSVILRSFLKYRGTYAGFLVMGSSSHLEHGDKRHARRAVWWALRISPLHVMSWLVIRPAWRRVIVQALSPI